jgi:hypothetical protein
MIVLVDSVKGRRHDERCPADTPVGLRPEQEVIRVAPRPLPEGCLAEPLEPAG